MKNWTSTNTLLGLKFATILNSQVVWLRGVLNDLISLQRTDLKELLTYLSVVILNLDSEINSKPLKPVFVRSFLM